eukprot:888971-Amphidinium_carterae.2
MHGSVGELHLMSSGLFCLMWQFCDGRTYTGQWDQSRMHGIGMMVHAESVWRVSCVLDKTRTKGLAAIAPVALTKLSAKFHWELAVDKPLH